MNVSTPLWFVFTPYVDFIDRSIWFLPFILKLSISLQYLLDYSVLWFLFLSKTPDLLHFLRSSSLSGTKIPELSSFLFCELPVFPLIFLEGINSCECPQVHVSMYSFSRQDIMKIPLFTLCSNFPHFPSKIQINLCTLKSPHTVGCVGVGRGMTYFQPSNSKFSNFNFAVLFGISVPPITAFQHPLHSTSHIQISFPNLWKVWWSWHFDLSIHVNKSNVVIPDNFPINECFLILCF